MSNPPMKGGLCDRVLDKKTDFCWLKGPVVAEAKESNLLYKVQGRGRGDLFSSCLA